jgi:hypothetical protein
MTSSASTRTKRAAGIGSRQTPKYILDWMAEMGAELVRQGWTVVSGNADGADSAWARGANSVDPAKLELWLAWKTKRGLVEGNDVRVFCELPKEEQERYIDIVRKLHPAWQYVSDNAALLLGRNAKIIEKVEVVFGYTPFKDRGGTMMGYKLAEQWDIPHFDVAEAELRQKLLENLRAGKPF